MKFHLADSYDLPMHFAWKAFQFQASLCLHQRVGHRPLSAAEITRIGSMRNTRRLKSSSAVPPTWIDRTSNNEEEAAATKIQATFRGYFLRKLARGYVKGMFARRGMIVLHKEGRRFLVLAWFFCIDFLFSKSCHVSKDCKEIFRDTNWYC